MDPFSQHDDAMLNDALRSAGLYNISPSRVASSSDLSVPSTSVDSATLHNGVHESSDSAAVTLDTQIEAGGSNLSLGQRYTNTPAWLMQWN
jgi:ABC-type multidrug transport system fused ATPase/permease subunit